MIGTLTWTQQRASNTKHCCGWTSIAFVLGLALSIFACIQPTAYAVIVTDDFSDLNDTANPTWTHLDGALISTGQTWDASTGQYHLNAPSNSTHPLLQFWGWVGSYTGPSFTDVRVSADFVDFTPTDFQGTVFGIAGRLDGDNRPFANSADPNQGLKGYSYQYEADANSGNGELVLTLIWPGAVKDMGSQKVTLDSSLHDYRFVLELLGNVVHGQVFELDTGNMVAEDFRDVVVEPVMIDADLNSGTPDTAHVPYTNGFSGVYGYGNVTHRDADFTLDNFRAETALAGDYDRNGTVNTADYTIWRSTYGEHGPTGNPPTAFGDLRANGVVDNRGLGQTIDAADYVFWRKHQGATIPGNGLGDASGVPEPMSAVLGLFGLVGLWSCRSRKLLSPNR